MTNTPDMSLQAVERLKPGYPDYVDDPDGLDRFRQKVRREPGHDMAVCNNNSLGRLIDTIERLRAERDAALEATPSLHPEGEDRADALWKRACIGREGYCSSDLQDAARTAIRMAFAEEEAAARSARLPEGYQWSEGNVEKFNFGRDRAADAIAALTPSTVTEGTVPAGMKAWHGGDAAPADYGSAVLFRNGQTVEDDEADGWRWRHTGSSLDIIAYTPKPAEGTVPDDGWVMVPLVPTEAMLDALARQAQKPTGWHNVYPAMYRALLAASPKPTIVEASGMVEREPVIFRPDRKVDAAALRQLADYIESDKYLKRGSKVSWMDCLEGVRRHYLSASSPSSEQGRG